MYWPNRMCRMARFTSYSRHGQILRLRPFPVAPPFCLTAFFGRGGVASIRRRSWLDQRYSAEVGRLRRLALKVARTPLESIRSRCWHAGKSAPWSSRRTMSRAKAALSASSKSLAVTITRWSPHNSATPQPAPERNELGAAVALVGRHCLASEHGASNGLALGSSAGDSPVAIARYRDDDPVSLVSRCGQPGSSNKQCQARNP
jgi:hypothetical protein